MEKSITYISILRGINVSGHRIIKMDALKKLCADLKFKNVQTFIQSGNIIFNFKKNHTGKISELLKTAIEKIFGFDVPVVTCTISELENIIQSNPFINDTTKDQSFLHVSFLSGIPAPGKMDALKQLNFQPDDFIEIENVIYLYCPGGYGNTKLTNNFFENKLKLTATTRNWKTINELLKMAQNNVAQKM